MAKWTDDLKMDLEKLTLSTATKEKIMKQQAKKEKPATIIPAILSVVLFAAMFLFLYNTDFTSQHNANVVVAKDFTELYIERVQDAEIKMHRSNLYSGVAKINESGIQSFQKYWDDKVVIKRETNDYLERQFIAYKDNGEKIVGLLFEEDEAVYMAVNDQIYKLPTTADTYMKELDFRAYDTKILILYLLFFIVTLYYDSRYIEEGKKQRWLNTLAVFMAVFIFNFNVYIPIVFVAFIIYSLLYYKFRGEPKQRYQLLNQVNFIFNVTFIVGFIITFFYLELNITTILSIAIGFVVVALYSEQMEKRLEPPQCVNCEHVISLGNLYRSYFTNENQCAHCENSLLVNKRLFYRIVALIISSVIALAASAVYLGANLWIIIIVGCLLIAQSVVVTIATFPLKGEKKPLL